LWRLAQPATGLLGRALEWGPVIWVGAISYEMYLWHWPTYLVLAPDRIGVTGGVLFAVRIATVVLLAWGTHALVDEPIRKGLRLRSPRLARVAAAAMVIALGAGVFGATVGAQPALSGQVGELADSSAPPTVPDRVSRPNPAQPSLAPGTATTAAPAGPVKMLVVGDSQAATLAQGVQAAPGVYGLSHLPGYAVWNRAILGCPIISAPTFRFDGNDITNKCGGAGYWQQQWPADVTQFAPDAVVVMAGAWDVFDVVQPDGSILHPGDPAWTAMYTQDVRQLFRALAAKGAAVVAVKPPCWGESTLVGTDQQIAERMDPVRVRAVDAAWAQASRDEGVTLLDLDRTLCPQGTADPALRPDGAHFSGAGADRIAALVAKAVEHTQAAQAATAAGGAAP
jgi:lysophospholipase L1-like esterase